MSWKTNDKIFLLKDFLLFVWKPAETVALFAPEPKSRLGGGEVHRTGWDNTAGLSVTFQTGNKYNNVSTVLNR